MTGRQAVSYTHLLEKIQELYTNKLIDPEMLVRSDCQEPVLAGKVGIFFGSWWSGYTVSDATLAGEADWRAYFTPLDVYKRQILQI